MSILVFGGLDLSTYLFRSCDRGNRLLSLKLPNLSTYENQHQHGNMTGVAKLAILGDQPVQMYGSCDGSIL